MKILERIIGKWQVLLLVLSMCAAMSAQHPQGPQGPPSIPEGKEIVKMVNQLDKKLDLNDAQYDKILVLYQSHFAAVKKTVSKGRPDRAVMETLQTTFEKGVKAELTKEQIKKFEAYQNKMMPAQGNGGNRPQH